MRYIPLFLQAAFTALLVSLVVGVIRLVLELVYPAPLCGEVDIRPAILAKVHYTYFGALSMGICSMVIVVVSLATKVDPSLDVSFNSAVQCLTTLCLT